MKNVKLLCLSLLIAGSANAQYFQHLYGSTRSEHLQSGVNAVATAPQGHIMTGYTDVPGINSLVVTSTDLNGNIPGGFNNWYRITEPNQPALDVKGRRVVQFASNRIGVWGDYAYGAGNLSTRFFYTLIAPNGVPGPTIAYQLPFPVVEVHATSMCVSRSAATANFVYVCGWERQTIGGNRSPVIMCLNWATGAIVWSFQYQVANISAGTDWIPADLVESPYPNSISGNLDIALTGSFVQPSGFLSGCFFTVDALAGFPSSQIVTYGSPNATQSFNAIEIANNPFGSGPGFVMAGTSTFAGGSDSWAMKINPTGMIVNFSTLQDYNPSDRNFGYDIIERLNTSLRYEYYVGGFVNNGRFGQNDDVVFKLDASGMPVVSGQFTYGGPGNEQAFQLDQYNGYGPQNDGLSVFGNTDGGSWPMIGGPDFYLVKAYFNGLQSTSCNWDTVSFDSIQGPGMYEVWQPTNPNKLKSLPLNIVSFGLTDWQICFGQNPFGSNARMAQTVENQILEPGYFPNPVSLDNPVINVTFGNVATQGEAEIELWNSLGQLVWTKKSPLTDGQTQMQVDLGNQLSGGIYQLVIRQNGTINNYRIVVK